MLYSFQRMVKASTAYAFLSGTKDTYFENCAFALDANKSMQGFTSSIFKASDSRLESSFHSISTCKHLDSLSASMFSFPATCAALIHISRSIHHSHISLHKLFK